MSDELLVEHDAGVTTVTLNRPDSLNSLDVATKVALRDTLATLGGDRAGSVAARHERLAMTVACKAAVKAGDALSVAEMQALFLALGETTLPAHDVHGRSTIVQLSWTELERRFGRA